MTSDRDQIVIVGAGETAELAREYFTHDSPYEVVGFAVESPYRAEASFCGLPVIDLADVELTYPPSHFGAFVAVSSTGLNRPRARLFEHMVTQGYELVSYVSSRALVWRTARIGRNCLVLQGNVLEHGVTIQDDVYLWSGSQISHRSRVGTHTFVSAHVAVAGFCDVGSSCFLGINSCVADGVTLAEDCVLGAGAVLLKSTEPQQVCVGNPARPLPLGSHERFGVLEG